MKAGLFGINYNACADPDACVVVARAAEAAGLDSVWTAEHLVLPTGEGTDAPFAASTPMIDTIASATWIAAHTTTIRIGTGIIILPLHEPVLLAKQLASVDVLSGGRLTVGLAPGYLREEFQAVGVRLEDRGQMMDDYTQAMIELWSSPAPSYQGRFVSFSKVDAHPRPWSGSIPKLVFGGGSLATFRRVATLGHGWYGFGMTLDGTRQCIDAAHDAVARYGRPDHLGEIEFIVTPIDGQDRDMIRRYEDLGVHCVVGLPTPGNRESRHQPIATSEILRTISALAEAVN